MSTLVYRKLVMPGDLNFGNSLFGGTLLSWLDESAASYAICQMKSKDVVTLKVSEILFKKPVKVGSFLVFYASTKSFGKTSLTIDISVFNRNIETSEEEQVLTCEFVFVKIDPVTGKSIPHNIS